MATNPIDLGDGTAITDWNQDVIEVSGPGGKTRIARAAAPPQLQQTVSAAERGDGGPAALVPQPGGSSSNPFGFIDPNTPAPGSRVPSTRIQDPTAPAAPDSPEPSPVAGGMANPMAAYDAAIAQADAAARSGGGGGAATRTATSRTSMPVAAQAEVRDMQTPIDESVAQQQLAIEDQAGVEAKAMGEASKLHAQQGQRIEQELKDQESLKASYEQRFATEQQKLADLNQRAQVEIDPQKYWKDKGTGNKILAAISMAVGAFVNARSEGRVANAPMQIIQTAIERDIASQVENRNRAERDVTRQAGFIGMLGDKYSDDLQKRQAALVLANEAVAKQIDGIAAGMQGEQAKAKALQLSAQLRQANAQRAQEFTAQIAGTETTQTQTASGGGAGRKMATAEAIRRMAYGDPEFHKTFIPGAFAATGEYRAANDPADAVELNKQSATVSQILRKVDQLEEAGKNWGKLSPQQRSNATSLYASLQLDVSKAEGLGAFDNGTKDITGDILGPKPTDLTTVATPLATFKQTVRAKHRAAIQNRTHVIYEGDVPASIRLGTAPGTGQQSAAPQTRPLAVEGP